MCVCDRVCVCVCVRVCERVSARACACVRVLIVSIMCLVC